MIEYRKEIHNYVQTHKNEMVETLKELVRIPSVRSKAEEKAPFGRECARVLEFVSSLYEENGFETELKSEGGYLLSYFGNGKKTLGIFAHADVVPAGDNWTYTKPFEPLEKDGCLIGRGVFDNKAAVVISLYCAKMLKELEIPFNSRLMCFTGSCEESGMHDIKNFLSAKNIPDFSIVADTAFPLYRGNKGCVRLTSKSTEHFSESISIDGGTGATVIGDAVVTLPYSEELFSELTAVEEERITIKKSGESLQVKATGIAKHSALPEGSLNAVALVSKLMLKIKSLNEKDRIVFQRLYEMANCCYGEIFSIENNDKEFGKLTCVLAKVETTEEGKVTVHFNIRHGADISKEFIIENIQNKLKEISFTLPEVSYSSTPDAFPENNSYIKRLIDVYRKYTGKTDATPYINAGGTYRQYLKKGVETGPTLKRDRPDDMPQGHGGAHQPDECISIDGMLQALELTMLMLVECDKS